MRRFNPQIAPVNISSHYTPHNLAKYCIDLTPIQPTDTVHDAARGGGAFYSQYPVSPAMRSYSEISEGKDFLLSDIRVDWIVTNPPYHVFWRYVEKSVESARKGFGFLVSSNPMLSLTPKRLAWLSEKNFSLTRLAVVNVKEWFGRYYYILFEWNGKSIIQWSTEKFSTSSQDGTQNLAYERSRERAREPAQEAVRYKQLVGS